MKSRVIGAGRLRRVLQQMPEEMTGGVKKALEDGAGEILFEMQRRVSKRTGDLAHELSAKKRSNGFTWKIGLNGKKANRRFFYARFEDGGTRHSTGSRFLSGSLPVVAPQIIKDVTDAVDDAFRRFAARGVGGG